MDLVAALARHLRGGALDELTLTTNGTQLARFAEALARHGVRRVNVSLDTLDPSLFRTLTRGGDLAQVLDGIAAAKAVGIAVKINTVALKRDNAAELPELIQWAHSRGHDLTLIETMPLGEVEQDRTDQFLSLKTVRQELSSFWTLEDLVHTTGGPARYARVAETGGRLGFITPLSHNFCEACNRVRLTCTGTLHTCLGHEDATDLRALLRSEASDSDLEAAIRAALDAKPRDTTSTSPEVAPLSRGTCRRRAAEQGTEFMARVLLFGRLADQAGWRERLIAADDIGALRAALAGEDPRLGEALVAPGVQVAVITDCP